MDKIKLGLILGTARKDANSQKVVDYIHDYLKTRDDLEVTYFALKEHDMDIKSEAKGEIAEYSKLVETCDGVFIVSPEYNHGFPGSLKFLLDLKYKEYENKAVAVCGVSNGPWGGVRMIESLIPILKAVGLKQTKIDLQVTNADDFPEKLPPNFDDRLKTLVDQLAWLAKVMKHGRENM